MILNLSCRINVFQSRNGLIRSHLMRNRSITTVLGINWAEYSIFVQNGTADSTLAHRRRVGHLQRSTLALGALDASRFRLASYHQTASRVEVGSLTDPCRFLGQSETERVGTDPEPNRRRQIFGVRSETARQKRPSNGRLTVTRLSAGVQ